MKLESLKRNPKANIAKHRKGRGHAAGKGKQAGKGQSGQNKRTGTRPGFEGGQNPWYRRLPKRGFKNVNRVEYQIINLLDLNIFKENELVNRDKLIEAKLINNKSKSPIKVLAKGSLEKKLNLNVDKISKKAKEAIEKLGGTIQIT
ncbi:MAG: 50S ribosomal protein L15 [Mycoplasma sp.]|nr:50S ribosomal protein L15 [Mycoplasma sp.]